jgi:hypothetical protein
MVLVVDRQEEKLRKLEKFLENEKMIQEGKLASLRPMTT